MARFLKWIKEYLVNYEKFQIVTIAFVYISAYVFVHLVPFLMPITQMSLSGSTFTTVALTVERYISVCTPFFRQRSVVFVEWSKLGPVI